MRYVRHVGWIGAALLLLASTAYAESPQETTRAVASAFGYAGVEAFQAGDFAGASQQLERAYALLKVPSLGLWSARALVELGRLVKAHQRYAEVTRLPLSSGDMTIQKQAQNDAARELAELGPRLPRLMIEVAGVPAWDVLLTIDAEPVLAAERGAPIAVDPGRRVIAGRYSGRTVRTEVELAERQHAVIELRFPSALRAAAVVDAPEGRPSATSDGPWDAIGWTALAVGGAGLAVGGAFGIKSMVERGNLEDIESCDLDRNRCAPDQRERVDAYNTSRIVSGVGLIAGGILAATGAYLVFLRPDPSPESSQIGLHMGPHSVAVHGRF